MADHPCALDAGRVEDRHEVGHRVREAIRVDRGGPVRRAEAAHVGREHAQAGRRERRHLVAPEVRGVRESMDEQDRRALALVEDLEVEPVARDAVAHGAAAYGPGAGVSAKCHAL